MKIDHIDGDTNNNSIDNLRLVDTKTNGRNRKRNVNSKNTHSHICRVSVNKNSKSSRCKDYYRVFIILNDKIIRKSFNINKLGETEALRQAVEYKEENKEAIINNLYSERHLYEK